MPRKKQTFQTVNGPVTVNVPINSELEGGLRILIDHSDIKQKWFDVPYGPHPDEVMDIYLPNEGEGPFPVIVMVHGGGWSDGDKNYWEVHGGIKAVPFGFAMASIRYRLAPEYPHPAQIQDVKAAIRFVKAHAEEYRLDPTKVAVWGGSAGGHLAALAGTSPNVPELTDRSLGNPDVDESVQAVVAWYAPIWLDRSAQEKVQLNQLVDELQAGEPTKLYQLLGCTKEGFPEAARKFSPATYLTRDCPPFLLQHGTEDPLVPYLESVEFDKALTMMIGEDNVTLDLIHGAKHGGTPFQSLDNIKRITDWLKQVLHIE